MKCRCGHGRSWHRVADRLSGWQRGRGEKRRTSAWLPCRFLAAPLRPTPPVKCPCRNWHPVGEVTK